MTPVKVKRRWIDRRSAAWFEQRVRGSGPLLAIAALLCSTVQASAHSPIDHPLRDVRVVCRSTPTGAFVVRGRWTASALPHPEVTGATIRLDGSIGAAAIELPAAAWRSTRRGPRYRGPKGAMIDRVGLRRGGRDARLVVRGADPSLCRPATAEIEMTVQIEDEQWCLRVPREAIVTRGRRLHARVATTEGSCSCRGAAADSTWALVQSRLIERHACGNAGCHGGAPAAAGLTLVGSGAHALLVGVPSEADPAVRRVEPGIPEDSMLWRKLAARTLGLTGVPGTPMPIGEPVPDIDELAGLAAWIASGAPASGHVAEADRLLDGCGGSGPAAP